jgi:pyruvate kinase
MTAASHKRILRQRQTKIVATLGPASSTLEVIRELFLTGVDVFRLNFSHGTHEDHKMRLGFIRQVEEEFGTPISVLADMQGPKLRVGRFKDGAIELQKGMRIRFDLDKTEGDASRVNLPHPEIIGAVAPGDMLLIDDGKVRVKVIEQHADALLVEVIAGTKMSNNKGVNVPGVVLPIPALTPKDRVDLEAALAMGVDWIAQSFVQKPEDVAEARKYVGRKAGLLIKIEKPSALEHMPELIDLADAVMLARGDLGVEIPAEQVPSVQKRIVRMVRQAGKPVIVATQMLESMIDSPSPTRAEASDVATAVYDGADAVMLSAETAAGKYPMEAVSIMDRICRFTERDETYRQIIDSDPMMAENDASDAITVAAHSVAHSTKAACIVNFTTSGSTTLRTARQRPTMPILCLSENKDTARRLALSYGVNPVFVETITNFGEAVQIATKLALDHGLAEKGQRLVVTAGVPFGTPGSTNSLRVAWVE